MYSCSSVFFFFFKQKTAYEMRISDWSSDVCSSDLLVNAGVPGPTVSGTLNNAPGTVSFTSTEDLIGLANGQARVGAADLVLNNPLTFTYNDGLISALEFNIDALTNGNVFFSFRDRKSTRLNSSH